MLLLKPTSHHCQT